LIRSLHSFVSLALARLVPVAAAAAQMLEQKPRVSEVPVVLVTPM
jgi:hypothetical protein